MTIVAGKRKTIATAAAFIGGVYSGYFLLGIGLNTMLSFLPAFSVKVIALIGLLIGVYTLYSSRAGSRFKSPVPRRLREITENKLYSVAGPLGGIILGLLSSLTLLPCSSGPYITFIAVLSQVREPMLSLALLAVYNLIFVTPLLIIAFIVTMLGSSIKRVKAWRSKGLGVMEAVSSLLLIIVCLYILIFYEA